MLLITQKSDGYSMNTRLQGATILPENLESGDIQLTTYSAEAVENLPSSPFLVRGGEWIDQILTDPSTEPLGKSVDTVQGLRTGNNTERLSTKKESEKHRRALGGEDIRRYGYDWSEKYVLYDRKLLSNDPAARPREEKYWESSKKILVQEIRNVHLDRRIVACIDTDKYIGLNTTNTIIRKEDSDIDLEYIMAILSSTLINQFFKACFVDNHIATQYLDAIPLFDPRSGTAFSDERMGRAWEQYESEKELRTDAIETVRTEDLGEMIRFALSSLAKDCRKAVQSKESLNLSLLDHLGNYDADGPLLTEVGFAQPPKGAADSILQETTETRANLRVGSVAVERETPSTVTIHLSARYKPEAEEEYATDRWGYTETDPLPALRITDLPETEADLIRAFVPVAVEEAGGFGGFRETATKTNSLIDRLEALTLPVLSEVERGLERYIDTRERAAELDEGIERTDELIDEIVYELYGLTDEEIEIVENAVGE